MRHSIVTTATALLALLVAPGCGFDAEDEGSPGYFEGVEYDSENPYAPVGGGKEDGNSYEVPTNLPTLVDPEIIVSLDGLTVHLFDRATGFSEVYPTGVGVLNRDGLSVTPTGHFATGPNTRDSWYYIARRWSPSYFGGFPFIRLTARNSRGEHTYGLHGPITQRLIRGYVSHGCMRMEGEDVVRVFYLIRNHASTPVTIQREIELDAAGRPVDVGSEVTLWPVGATIDYGRSVGDPPPRDETGTDADGCADDRLESDQPAPIEPGMQRGLILCAGDVDRYSFELAPGQRATVHIHFVDVISDLELRVFDAASNVVGQSTGSTDDETVSFVSEAGGRFVAEVYHYGDGATNGYFLDLAVE